MTCPSPFPLFPKKILIGRGPLIAATPFYPRRDCSWDEGSHSQLLTWLNIVPKGHGPLLFGREILRFPICPKVLWQLFLCRSSKKDPSTPYAQISPLLSLSPVGPFAIIIPPFFLVHYTLHNMLWPDNIIIAMVGGGHN